jgi:hypothetical protein
MIALDKGPIPVILDEHWVEWRDEYLEAKANNTLTNAIRFRYRHADIKTAIVEETHNKCAYCESKVTHVHPGETEHILPISERPDLIVTWINLTLACTECNRRKSNYYEPDEPLVNPYDDDPSAHLMFIGVIVLPKGDKGRRTWHLLELTKRMALMEQKKEKLEKMNLLLERYLALPESATKSFLKDELLAETASHSEYAATARSFLSTALGWQFDRSGALI